MKTGIELISIERQEQIEKHGRTIQQDVALNANGQLVEAACNIAPYAHEGHLGNDWPRQRPSNWNPVIWEKMCDKSYKDRLIIAGALIAAEIDRLNYSES